MDQTFLTTPLPTVAEAAIVDPVAEIMDSLPLHAIHDDELYAALAAEGFSFKDPGDAFCWASESYSPSTSHWPDCGCSARCSACPGARFVVSSRGGVAKQTLHHLTGEPLPPDHHRLQEEAFQFKIDHSHAAPWLRDRWFDDDKELF